MACHLFCAKPIYEPVMTYSQLDPYYMYNEILFKIKKFSFKKMYSEVHVLYAKKMTISFWLQCVNKAQYMTTAMQSFVVFLDVSLNKLLNKWLSCQWFEAWDTMALIWHHCHDFRFQDMNVMRKQLTCYCTSIFHDFHREPGHQQP